MKLARVAFLVFIAMISANTLVDRFNCVVEDAKKRFKTTSDHLQLACQTNFKRAVDYYRVKKSEVMEKASGLIRKYMKSTEKKAQEAHVDETENEESTFDSAKATPSEIMEMIRRMLEEQAQQEEAAQEEKKKEKEASEKKEL